MAKLATSRKRQRRALDTLDTIARAIRSAEQVRDQARAELSQRRQATKKNDRKEAQESQNADCQYCFGLGILSDADVKCPHCKGTGVSSSASSATSCSKTNASLQEQTEGTEYKLSLAHPHLFRRHILRRLQDIHRELSNLIGNIGASSDPSPERCAVASLREKSSSPRRSR